jgi:hypothetical protein
MSTSRSDKEFDAFRFIDGQWHRLVTSESSFFETPKNAQAIRKTQPSSLVDVYRFYSDVAETTLLKTITITYDNLSRDTFKVTAV